MWGEVAALLGGIITAITALVTAINANTTALREIKDATEDFKCRFHPVEDNGNEIQTSDRRSSVGNRS